LDKYVDDDAFHTWRFDWHTDPADRRVEFYLDGIHLRTMRNFIPFYAGRLWIGAWFPNTWVGEANFAEAQMEVEYVKFTPFDEVYECPSESYPDFGWATGTDVGLGENALCGYTASPVAPSTPPPTIAPATPSPNAQAPTTAPAAANYINDGCISLSSTFCSEFNGGFCKDWQTDSCGRSICQGDTHSSLNPCMTPPPTHSVTTNPTNAATPEPTAKPVTKSPTRQPNQKPATPAPVTSNPTPSPPPTSVPITPLPTPNPTNTATPEPAAKPVTESPTRQPTQKPVTPAPITSNPTPSPPPTSVPITPLPTMNPTNAATPEPTESNPVSIYLSQGCTASALLDTFCSSYNGGYCKSWQSDHCGRSVCKGDSHSSFSPCPVFN